MLNETCEAANTLAEVLEQQRCTTDEVCAWFSALATELSALHEMGQAHGSVTAANVAVTGGIAHLLPSLHAGDDTSQDIVRFAALLREMLDSIQPECEAARAKWNALDRVASTNAIARPGSRMKKIALALRLLNSTAKVVVQAPAPVMEAASPAPTEPAARRPRVLLLVREVKPEAPARRRRFVLKTIHVWAILVSMAGVAAAACLMFLRFTR